MTEEPPRLRHNRELHDFYIRANKVYFRYPKVTEQIETIPLPFTPREFGYNPAIIEHQGKLLMAYRYHADGSLATKLAWNDGLIDAGSSSEEDPKLFDNNGTLYISWVESTWPEEPPSCFIKMGAFNNGIVTDISLPRVGEMNRMEKNWVFFSWLGGLFCIYRCQPDHIVEGLNPRTRYVTISPRWAYGMIKGGTPPIPYEGKWLRFFHSTLDNDIGIAKRRYYVGALLMSSKPPFEVVNVSSKPIIYGSEVDDLTKEQRKSCYHWKPQVVFPGGAVERDGCWWLSLGINDSACVIAKVKPENLNL